MTQAWPRPRAEADLIDRTEHYRSGGGDELAERFFDARRWVRFGQSNACPVSALRRLARYATSQDCARGKSKGFRFAGTTSSLKTTLMSFACSPTHKTSQRYSDRRTPRNPAPWRSEAWKVDAPPPSLRRSECDNPDLIATARAQWRSPAYRSVRLSTSRSWATIILTSSGNDTSGSNRACCAPSTGRR